MSFEASASGRPVGLLNRHEASSSAPIPAIDQDVTGAGSSMRSRFTRFAPPAVAEFGASRDAGDDDERAGLLASPVDRSPGASTGLHAGRIPRLNLDYDPHNPAAMQATIDEIERTNVDPRIVEVHSLQGPPLWVHRWADLRFYNAGPAGVAEEVQQSVLAGVRRDIVEAQQLLQDLQYSNDGGVLSKSAALVEHVDDGDIPTNTTSSVNALMSQIISGTETPFWKKRGASLRAVEELLAYLRELERRAMETAHLEKQMTGGLDGTQVKAMANVFSRQRRASIHRELLGNLCQWSSTPSSAPPRGDLKELERQLSAYDVVPLLHAEFLQDEHPVQMDPDALRDPDMLSPPQSIIHSENDQTRKVVTISVNFVRLRDHPYFVDEHRFASELLDAFEAYQLLSANLMPNIRSRHFYEEILRNNQAASKSSAKMHKSVINAAQDLFVKACDVERTCLNAMMNAWRCMQRVREATQSILTTLTFSLRKRGDPEMPVYNDQDDILLYAPVISEMDAVAVPPSFPQTTLTVTVFARTSPSLPPQPVGSTAPRPLNSVFSAIFNESFELRTMREPTEILLHMKDDHDRVVASVRVPASLSHQAVVVALEAPIHYDGRIALAGATGSGTGALAQVQKMNGVMSITTTWTTAQGYTMEAIERMFLRGEADPLDPRNEPLVSLLEKYYAERGAVPTSGRLSTSIDDTPRSRQQKQRIQSGRGGLNMPLAPVLDTRLGLLRKRWNVALGDDFARNHVEASILDQPIPFAEHEASALTKKIEKESSKTQEDDKLTGGLLAIKSREQKLLDWREKIRNSTTTKKKSKRMEDHELLARYIVVPPIPTFRRVIEFVVNALNPQSNLNPKRDQRLELHEIDRGKVLLERSAKITVHVMKAIDLPYRQAPSLSGTDGAEQSSQQLLLEPFVDVSFVGQTANTRVEAGNNPAWFESLSVPFEPLNFEDETLALIDDYIVLAIYDKVQITLPRTEVTVGADAHVTHFRTEHRLLGTVKVPFYTLYSSEHAHLEAQYPVTIPRLLMGYELPPHAPTLHVYISLWPPLHRSVKNFTDVALLEAKLDVLPVSYELRNVHVMCLRWKLEVEARLAAVREQNPQANRREVEPFVNNSAGDPTLACRYVTPRGGVPPAGVETIYDAIRYVSLIPFAADLLVWDEGDVWSTNVEFIEAGFGDYEEHALLLLHLLRYIAPIDEFYIVVGIGDIFEQATYILHIPSTRNASDIKLIDPRTGDVYMASDPRIAFSEVGMVISHDQLYANIQLSGTPYRMIWDLQDFRYWLPMFPGTHGQYSDYIDCIQRERLVFSPISENRCALIEDRLKKLIRKNLRAWRRNKAPMFQERIGQILKDVLIELERERRESANVHMDYVAKAHQSAMAEFSSEYAAVGMPVCVAYKDEDFEELITVLHETAVHDIGTDNVRYALGVYAYAYTGTTIAVWAYLVALLPTERRLRI